MFLLTLSSYCVFTWKKIIMKRRFFVSDLELVFYNKSFQVTFKVTGSSCPTNPYYMVLTIDLKFISPRWGLVYFLVTNLCATLISVVLLSYTTPSWPNLAFLINTVEVTVFTFFLIINTFDVYIYMCVCVYRMQQRSYQFSYQAGQQYIW